MIKGFLDQKIKQEERIAATVAENEWADVKQCPICGCNTFIELTEAVEDTDNYDNIINMWEYVYSMECHQCGFHLNSWLLSMLKDLNLPPCKTIIGLKSYKWHYKLFPSNVKSVSISGHTVRADIIAGEDHQRQDVAQLLSDGIRCCF